MIPLSVIIPFYNSAKYLRRTTRSLLAQTLADIEYIFVDDGSLDSSRKVIEETLEEFPEKKNQVIICSSRKDGKNGGIGQARQAGLEKARGEYITYCDSDDWLDEKYYENLYLAVIANNADMAVGDHCLESKDSTTLIRTPDLRNWEEFKHHSNWFHLSLWNRIIRRALIKENNLRFEKGINLAEDYGFVIKAYFYSKKNCHIGSDALYHYDKTNEASLTTNVCLSSNLQRIQNLKLIDSFFKERNEDLTACGVHKIEKFVAKNTLISHGRLKLWKSTFPETASMIFNDDQCSKLYKCVYMSSQYLSWRILYLYNIAHKLR
ncbi:MAG: glycosyltransferase [Muribaculaceae bacterium]|nr:glycosyltransferase [Muribaculaceae bacterium]